MFIFSLCSEQNKDGLFARKKQRWPVSRNGPGMIIIGRELPNGYLMVAQRFLNKS
jgi:hypothetical protein